MFNTVLTLMLWVWVLFSPKNADFFAKKAGSSKIKWALIVKGIFSEKKNVSVLTGQIWSF